MEAARDKRYYYREELSDSDDETTVKDEEEEDETGSDDESLLHHGDDDEYEDDDDFLAPFWDDMKAQAIEACNTRLKKLIADYLDDGHTAEEAGVLAYNETLPLIRKALNKLVERKVTMWRYINRDHIFKEIKQKKKDLKIENELDDDRAWNRAIRKNKTIDELIIPERTVGGGDDEEMEADDQ